ncbi:Fe-S-containing hydro-lyase [bacterium]|nr:Fe-S-containing hydro-lyase [bacterium]
MLKERKIQSPLSAEEAKKFKAGDKVLISGTLFTARDEAHQRLVRAIERGAELPIPIKNQIIYYAGPTPAPPGRVIGSCGPTTSARMDSFTPQLLRKGLRGMIGKGHRSSQVIKAIKDFRAVYFIAIGGAGALLSKCVQEAEVVAYRDLGPEAIYRLTVVDFPAWVAIDSQGRNILPERTSEHLAERRDGAPGA